MLAFFHPLTEFSFGSTDTVTQRAFRGAAVGAIVSLLAILISLAAIPSYLTTFRFSDLPPLPMNWSNAEAFESIAAVCTVRYHDFSILQLLGLAFGWDEVNRNNDVFVRQLEYFFGPADKHGITYNDEELLPDVPFVVYNMSDTIIFEFRVFALGKEFALQMELLARFYGVPTLLDLTPFCETINDYILSTFTHDAQRLEKSYTPIAISRVCREST
jgi:hypothetical protein